MSIRDRYTATEPKEIVKELALMKAENVASDIEAEKGLLIDTVCLLYTSRCV